MAMPVSRHEPQVSRDSDLPSHANGRFLELGYPQVFLISGNDQNLRFCSPANGLCRNTSSGLLSDPSQP